jgi:hypothetical protein
MKIKPKLQTTGPTRGEITTQNPKTEADPRVFRYPQAACGGEGLSGGEIFGPLCFGAWGEGFELFKCLGAALYSVFPALTRSARAEGIARSLADLNGEAPAPFSFIQLSDTHVGFNRPPRFLYKFLSATGSINRM